MLKWISKSGTLIQFSIFIVILVVTWFPAFANPVLPVISPSDGPFYLLLVSWINHFPTLSVSIALILVVIQALILFYIFQANGFFKKNNFLPAIIILLAYSWSNKYQTMHAILPAGIFIAVALNSIMVMYGRQAAYRQVFTAAFSIGIASLFYIPLAFLLLMIWFTFITYRISSWNEYAVSVIGFILPFLYYISGLFWYDNLPKGLYQLSESMFNFILPPRLSSINTIWLYLSALVMIVTMIAVLNLMNDKLISLRRRSWVLFNFSFAVLIIMLVSGWPILSANYLFAIPMSFFITGSVTLIKRKFWFEMLALGYFLAFVAVRVYWVIS
jgi:hypothetical protein